MKRLLVLVGAALLLIAATPDDVLPPLQANGYYIEDGSNATEQVVSDAVFNGRAAGGRLYIVVLSEEPPGGATTFADSTLDLLGTGYVLVVAPETVGWTGDSTAWTADEMNAAVRASLDGGSDDEVVDLFISNLTEEPTTEPAGGSSGGGSSLLWLVVVGVAVVGGFMWASSRGNARRAESRMAHVKSMAKEKLNEVANDILEMEDEVSTSGNADVQAHYQKASALYSEAVDANDRATSVQEMMKVSENLDLAIWELDCAEAILDGKPAPAKPKPPPTAPVTQSAMAEGQGGSTSPPSDFDRRPQRQSSGSGDMLNVLLTMMALGSMRNRGGGFGGFGGSSGGWTGGGGGRIGGGGSRMGGGGGGRIRGGGHRRG